MILVSMAARTGRSQPGRAVAGRFRQISQMEEERAAPVRDRWRLARSVWIGQDASTTNPERMRALTSVSQASGDLLAKTMTNRPSPRRTSRKRRKVRAIPCS